MNPLYASDNHSYEIVGTAVRVKQLVGLYGQKVVSGKAKTKSFSTPQEALNWVKDRIKKDKQCPNG